MIAETITFYGGPRHGEKMAIPGSDTGDLEVTVALTNDRLKGTRKGHYTRVHNVAGNPSRDFEWAGFTAPFVPLVEV